MKTIEWTRQVLTNEYYEAEMTDEEYAKLMRDCDYDIDNAPGELWDWDTQVMVEDGGVEVIDTPNEEAA